ncbi:hypothetical protein [Novosphingobium sp. UBA1939]|uniref:hypothetical protein n=1 Tax=Novosphingobium sp. UBA1939 TaxID=1946982 RepID=UPI0025FDED88|nr:hypothetical protein [Novosphingobium sp. UBA1939]
MADAIDFDAKRVEPGILAFDHAGAFVAQQVQQRSFQNPLEHGVSLALELGALLGKPHWTLPVSCG